MILDYKKETSVLESGGYVHIVDGAEVVDDLMITKYTPINFEGTVKNFVLGDNHVSWDRIQQEALEKFHTEWLIELGYNTENYYVASTTKAIVRRQEIGTLTTFEPLVIKSEEI